MNYLILMHNKYHSNEKKENNRNNFDFNHLHSSDNLMDIENSKDNKINNTIENNKLYFENEKEINNGKYINNNELNYKNENLNKINSKTAFFQNFKKINFNNLFNDLKKLNKESILHSFNKPSKRKYLDLLKDNENKDDKIIINNTKVINMNINNNNYYYLNNSKYNINFKEKYGIDFSKQKAFKKY